MPVGRMIGMSLALIALSMAAAAKTTEKGAPGHHVKTLRAGARSGRPAVVNRSHAGVAVRRRGRGSRGEYAGLQVDADQLVDAYQGPMHSDGNEQIGEAAWYGREGGRTASGERMNGVALTAAHRSLPLDSFVKVTNLDNGRSAIIKINDRGPVSPHFIIDLSRPAARKLGIAGTAAVSVEPMQPGITEPPKLQVAAANPVAPAPAAPPQARLAAYQPAPGATAQPQMPRFPLLHALFGGPEPTAKPATYAAAPAAAPPTAAVSAPSPAEKVVVNPGVAATPSPAPKTVAAVAAPAAGSSVAPYPARPASPPAAATTAAAVAAPVAANPVRAPTPVVKTVPTASAPASATKVVASPARPAAPAPSPKVATSAPAAAAPAATPARASAYP